MKLRTSLVFALGTAVFVAAQTPVTVPTPFQTPAPPPDSQKPLVSPETVVVTIEGKPYMAKELDEFLAQYPPQVRDGVMKSPEQELTKLFAMSALAADAKKQNLDKVSPYKDAIESRVRNYLANIQVQDVATKIRAMEPDLQAYYQSHIEEYKSVKISAIYVNYTPNPKPGPDGKMPRTEAEAKAKADDLVKQLRAGADFAKLAAAHSDDADSAKKGGDYATIRRTDSYPPQIKEAIFKLKDGDISDPVKQAPGFYIFKVTARITQPYTEVQPTLFDKVRQAKIDAYIKGMQKDLAVKVEKPEYFSPKPNASPISTPPDTVVANVAGKPYTAKEMDEILKILPPQAKAALAKETEASLTSLFMIVRLSDEAKSNKLDQASPNKEAIAMFNLEGLTNAAVVTKQNAIEVTPADLEAYYKAHPDQFEAAKVSIILVSFGANRKEEEAKAKAEDLVKQLRAGADFSALVKANSDDKDSAAKDGEYATVHRSDKLAEATKKAIFALKPGEVSDPLRQPAGFYIFKVTSKPVQTLAEVSAAIQPSVKQEKFNKWTTGLLTQYKAKIEKPEYFKK